MGEKYDPWSETIKSFGVDPDNFYDEEEVIYFETEPFSVFLNRFDSVNFGLNPISDLIIVEQYIGYRLQIVMPKVNFEIENFSPLIKLFISDVPDQSLIPIREYLRYVNFPENIEREAQFVYDFYKKAQSSENSENMKKVLFSKMKSYGLSVGCSKDLFAKFEQSPENCFQICSKIESAIDSVISYKNGKGGTLA